MTDLLLTIAGIVVSPAIVTRHELAHIRQLVSHYSHIVPSRDDASIAEQ